jgi:ethanolaminephosphotransferase
MNLPIINGPSEGMLIGVALTLANLYTGSAFWWAPHSELNGAAPAEAIICASVAAIVMTIVKQTVHVVAKRSEADGARAGLSALWDLSGFVLMAVGASLWLGGTFGAGGGLFSAHPYACVFLFGAINVDLLSDLMLAHIAGAKFNPLPPVLLPLALVCLNAGAIPGVPLLPEALRVDQSTALHAYLALALVYVAVRLVRIVIEVRDALGIYVFSLKKRNMD